MKLGSLNSSIWPAHQLVPVRQKGVPTLPPYLIALRVSSFQYHRFKLLITHALCPSFRFRLQYPFRRCWLDLELLHSRRGKKKQQSLNRQIDLRNEPRHGRYCKIRLSTAFKKSLRFVMDLIRVEEAMIKN